ncbi:MAG TPA: hypothetical protein RMH99_01680, partial [Sandaracinaceae bacterium LLY-WYZ-13_1]|nr:hypothetical protein [Sandaracinaceae bacterium LLY-WYZ-13_1]
MTAFEITDPCQEPWERMKPRAEGRYCERCERTVIDLSRMTRREAERRVRAATEDRICVQLALDPLDRPVFRPEPKRAPHWAGGLV